MKTQIKIDNVINNETAEKIINKLRKVTDGNYHNFTYHVCPAYGSFDIILESDYEFESEDPEKEMLEFFNYMLVHAFTK